MAVEKAIVLAGGAGTRLYPMTAVGSKQLLPVYNKPMIYYSISTLMLLGIRKFLVITTPLDIDRFKALLGDGTKWKIEISYASQSAPRGIAEALIIGREFQARDSLVLMLGDNIFYGKLDRIRQAFKSFKDGALVFGYPVKNPSRYGVLGFGPDGRVESIEEKPREPKSRYAVPGLYIYDSTAPERAASLDPSGRGELEITDLNKGYLVQGQLEATLLGRGMAWLDAGTFMSLLDATRFIEAVESRQGLMIGCVEEVAIKQGLIKTGEDYERMVESIPSGPYRSYVEMVWREMSART
ncbi:MAG: glucose-1-phosphate thymidylyltransferase RfbA [Deltaproteobacteria bacterium]|nr:glucose-1-phosphate thymidylyltransferase RfbA [Deltaproteobacteria bacterium]